MKPKHSYCFRQWKLHREKLHSDFTRALDSFQRAQRQAAQKEKDVIRYAIHSKFGGLLVCHNFYDVFEVFEFFIFCNKPLQNFHFTLSTPQSIIVFPWGQKYNSFTFKEGGMPSFNFTNEHRINICLQQVSIFFILPV